MRDGESPLKIKLNMDRKYCTNKQAIRRIIFMFFLLVSAIYLMTLGRQGVYAGGVYAAVVVIGFALTFRTSLYYPVLNHNYLEIKHLFISLCDRIISYSDIDFAVVRSAPSGLVHIAIQFKDGEYREWITMTDGRQLEELRSALAAKGVWEMPRGLDVDGDRMSKPVSAAVGKYLSVGSLVLILGVCMILTALLVFMFIRLKGNVLVLSCATLLIGFFDILFLRSCNYIEIKEDGFSVKNVFFPSMEKSFRYVEVQDVDIPLSGWLTVKQKGDFTRLLGVGMKSSALQYVSLKSRLKK